MELLLLVPPVLLLDEVDTPGTHAAASSAPAKEKGKGEVRTGAFRVLTAWGGRGTPTLHGPADVAKGGRRGLTPPRRAARVTGSWRHRDPCL